MSTTITSMTAVITAAQKFSGSGVASGVSATGGTAAAALLAQNPGAKLLDAQISRDNAKLSGIGKVALALDDFKSLASGLSSGGLNLAASASGTGLTAQVSGSGAGVGTHTVDVKQLAQGQQLTSKAQPSSSAALGSGAATLVKIQTGSGSDATTTTVRIDSGNNTLDGIAKAMQDAGIDAKVSASGKGYALTLTGASGAANAMRISVSGDAAVKGLLTYAGDGKSDGLTQVAAAQDALVTVDGKSVASAGNKLDSAIAGVTLTLSATGKNTVTVAGDASATAANVKSFVAAFNTLNAQLGTLKSANSDTTATVNAVLTQVGSVLAGADKTALAALGITRKNGSLSLDEKKLNAAIAANPDAVASTFSNGGSGLADRMASLVTQQMATGGLLAKQSAAVTQDVTKLTAQKTKLGDALTRQSALLAQQYASGGTSGSALFGLLGGGTSGTLFDLLG